MKSRFSILVTDIFLIAGLALCLLSDKNIHPNTAWQSFHCIISTAWLAGIALHVWQHWKLVTAFRMPKVRRKNKLTTLTIVAFTGMLFSIAALIAATTPRVIHFHHLVSHLFLGVVILHTIAKGKRMLILIGNHKSGKTKPAGL